MPNYLPSLTATEYWMMGAAGSVILFVSVLVHELAHSKLATRYGIKVNQIVLFLFGGVSDIDRIELTGTTMYFEFKPMKEMIPELYTINTMWSRMSV